jgi:hypothetical protein
MRPSKLPGTCRSESFWPSGFHPPAYKPYPGSCAISHRLGLGIQPLLGSPNSGLPGRMKLSRDRVVIDWAELDTGIHIDSEDDWGCQVPCSGNGDVFSGCGEKGFSHKLVRSPPFATIGREVASRHNLVNANSTQTYHPRLL